MTVREAIEQGKGILKGTLIEISKETEGLQELFRDNPDLANSLIIEDRIVPEEGTEHPSLRYHAYVEVAEGQDEAVTEADYEETDKEAPNYDRNKPSINKKKHIETSEESVLEPIEEETPFKQQRNRYIKD